LRGAILDGIDYTSNSLLIGAVYPDISIPIISIASPATDSRKGAGAGDSGYERTRNYEISNGF
jgi:hypothetical protein